MGRIKALMIEKLEFPEGATPINDCSGLIPTWVHNLNDLNRVEAENIFQAQRKYLRSSIADPKKWFQVGELITIHRAMFENVWEWAGIYRKSVTSVGVKPSLIPLQLAELCLEVNAWFQYPTELTFLEMAARIHHRLVFIHPFENGNGRFSRLIADRFLFAWKCSYPIWPNRLNEDSLIRKDYIQTLKRADKGDYEPLVLFIKNYGATDPKISEFIQKTFYRKQLKEENGASLLKALIRRGDDPNERTITGSLPLHLAVKANLEAIVKVLIELGAEINAQDKRGLTPLQIAYKTDNSSLISFLLSKGAKT
jgi:Fic-DOC domain mobile mystery protein B